MADTVTVTFTRPVRVHKKKFGPHSKPTPIEADIADVLIQLGAAKAAEPAKEAPAKEPPKKA